MKKNSPFIRIEYLLILISTFFWALGHPVGKIIVQTVHPFQLATLNMIIGFFSLFLYLAFAGKLRELIHISVKDLVVSLILGVFGFFFYQIATFSALARIPASMNAILISTSVIFIALLSALILKEKILIFKILGILLSLAGVIMVTFNRGFSLESKVGILGCLFSLSGAISFALYTIFGKRVLEGNDPLIVSTYSLFSGAVLLTILTLLTTGFGSLVSVSSGIWLLIVMISVTMIGIAYPLWFFCLKRMQASHVSIYIYLTPVFGVILSLVILKERFSWPFWFGAALVLAGIVITSAFSRKKRGFAQ